MKVSIISLFIFTNCITVDEPFEGRVKPIPFSICFWKAENLTSKKLMEWSKKRNYLLELVKRCDTLSFTAIGTDNENISTELEDYFLQKNLNYSCIDSFPRLGEQNQILNQTKYTTCVNNNRVVEMKRVEYSDTRKDFSAPPTYFFLELTNGAKVSILPFHANQGNRNELIDFEKIVNYAYQKHSDRKTFFGGDFYIDKKYQSETFLKSLLYFQILKNLISEPTTFTNEKNDAIFTDYVSQLTCSGKALSPEKISTEFVGQKEFQTVSSHFPVIANCRIK